MTQILIMPVAGLFETGVCVARESDGRLFMARIVSERGLVRPTPLKEITRSAAIEMEDVPAAWWLEQFGHLSFSLGDRACFVGPREALSCPIQVATAIGAGGVLAVSTDLPYHPGSDKAVEIVSSYDELALSETLEGWFGRGPGRSFLIGIDLAPGILTQCLKALPVWGHLLLAESMRSKPLIVDFYRDVHRRGIEVLGAVPWRIADNSAGDESRLPLKPLLEAASSLRVRNRTQIHLPTSNTLSERFSPGPYLLRLPNG